MHVLRKEEVLSSLFRLLGRLRRKNPIQVRLEQLEQGFSLYLNGANSELGNYRRKIKSRGYLKNEAKTTRTNGELGESLSMLSSCLGLN